MTCSAGASAWALHHEGARFRGETTVLCGGLLNVVPDPNGRGPILRVEVDELPVVAFAYQHLAAGVGVGSDVCVYGRVAQRSVPWGAVSLPAVMAVAVVDARLAPPQAQRRAGR